MMDHNFWYLWVGIAVGGLAVWLGFRSEIGELQQKLEEAQHKN